MTDGSLSLKKINEDRVSNTREALSVKNVNIIVLVV